MIILSRLQIRDFRSLRNVDLRFPRQASILVEGLNEAGKSSLFEAVYFALYGEPLVTEEAGQRGRPRHDSAINYRAERAAVILTLDVDGTVLEVSRTLRRGQAAQAHLSVDRPGTGTEAVTGARPVTERVIQELGNLDNETLLNSCFVEQKKLAKLEDLTPAARRESLEHLLNMDKMQALHEEFRVTAQDKAAVQVLQDRLSLARAQARVPFLETELEDVRLRRVAVAMHEAFARIAEYEATRAELLQQEEMVKAHKSEVAELRRRIVAIKHARDGVRALQAVRAEIDRATREIASLSLQIADLDRRAREDLPRLEGRLEALSDLIAGVRELERLAQARRDNDQAARAAEDELAQIDAHSASARGLTAEIAALQAEVDRAIAAIVADEAAAQDAMISLTARREELEGLQHIFQQKAEVARQERTAQEAVTTAREQMAAYERLLSDLRAQEEAITTAASTLATAEALLAAENDLAEIDTHVAAARGLATEVTTLGAEVEQVSTVIAADEKMAQDTMAGLAARREDLADLQRLFQQEAEIARQEQAAQEAVATTREHVGAYERLLSDLRTAEDVIASASSTLAIAEAGFERARQRLAGTEEARALVQWLQGKGDLTALAGHQSSAQGTAQGVADAQRVLAERRAAQARARQRVVVPAIGSGVALVAGVVLFVLGLAPLAALLLLGGLLAGGLAGRGMANLSVHRQACVEAQHALDEVQAAQVRAEATRAAAQQLGGGDARVAEAEAALLDLGLVPPRDQAAAEARLADLRRSSPPDLASARADLDSARLALDDARRQQAGVAARGDTLREHVAAHPGSRLSAADLEQMQAAVAALAQRRRSLELQMAQVGAQWGVAPSTEAVARAHTGILEEIARARDIVAALPVRRETVATKQVTLQARQHALAEERVWLDAHDRVAVTARIAALTKEQETPASARAAHVELTDLQLPREANLASAAVGLESARARLDEARRQHAAAVARGDAVREQIAAHLGRQLSPADLEQREIAAAHLAHQRGGLEEQIAQATERWGLAPSEDAIATAMAGVQEEIAHTRDVLAAVPARRDTVATKKTALEARQGALAGERAWLGAHNWGTVNATIASLKTEADTLARAHAAHEERAAEQARVLGVLPEMAALQQAHGAVTQEREHLLSEVARRPALLAQRDADQQTVEEQQRQGQAAWQALLPLPEDIGAEDDLPDLPGLTATETALGHRLEALDEDSVERRQRDLDQQHGTIQADLVAATRAIADKHQEITRLLAQEGLPTAHEPAAVGASFPIFGQVTVDDRLPLEERQNALYVDLETTRRQRDELASALSLRGAQLDEAACAAELAAHHHDLEVRSRAERIIRGVRERMVEKVLPNTERNMSMLLPLLTLDRYRDCQITPDYKLQIWDEMAGRYVGKSIFSGGTRDQFSLALRLAFALATLPEELGTTPGFIFLDEPLSSFDGPRTEALINLLTTGQIATNFAQIFVISHNLMFERGAFTHHLRLADGKVVEHDFDRPIEVRG